MTTPKPLHTRARPTALAVRVVAAVTLVALLAGCGSTSEGSTGAAPAAADPTASPTGTRSTDSPGSSASIGDPAGTSTTTSAAPTVAPASTISGPASTSPAPATATGGGAFADVDSALDNRVARASLAGGALLIVRDGQVVHEHNRGQVGRQTVLSVASSAKWLTAATLLTFVDQGVVGLDDPVSRWLPEFAGEQPPVTVRQLLVHTSGVRDQSCLWNTGGQLADCVRAIAAAPREFAPGTAFSYGNADFHVIGRVIEVVGGADFVTVFRQRIGTPLGMSMTSWPGEPNNPSPAAGTRTTVDDYAKFLALILGRGEIDGRRLLSVKAVDELVRNQVGAYDTGDDYAVGITTIPRYSLGAWPDVVDGNGTTVVVSGNGGRGFYPWVDFSTNSYGIVGVQDDRGAEVAVPSSQAVATIARNSL